VDEPRRRIPVDDGTATLVESTRCETFRLANVPNMIDATLAEMQPETAEVLYRDGHADEVVVHGPRVKTGTRGRIAFGVTRDGKLEPHWRLGNPPTWLRQLVAGTLSAAVEYATQVRGGDMLVWDDSPAWRIAEVQRTGGRVLRRRVIVLDDWHETRPEEAR
jgi:hypothetical protein